MMAGGRGRGRGRGRAGFSLAEVGVSIAVLGAAVYVMGGAFSTVNARNKVAEDAIYGRRLAVRQLNLFDRIIYKGVATAAKPNRGRRFDANGAPVVPESYQRQPTAITWTATDGTTGFFPGIWDAAYPRYVLQGSETGGRLRMQLGTNNAGLVSRLGATGKAPYLLPDTHAWHIMRNLSARERSAITSRQMRLDVWLAALEVRGTQVGTSTGFVASPYVNQQLNWIAQVDVVKEGAVIHTLLYFGS